MVYLERAKRVMRKIGRDERVRGKERIVIMEGEVRGPRKREREIPISIYLSFRVLLRVWQFPTTIK